MKKFHPRQSTGLRSGRALTAIPLPRLTAKGLTRLIRLGIITTLVLLACLAGSLLNQQELGASAQGPIAQASGPAPAQVADFDQWQRSLFLEGTITQGAVMGPPLPAQAPIGNAAIGGLAAKPQAKVTAKAADTKQLDNYGGQKVAAVSRWQGASFPVENFQMYTSPFGYRLSPTGSLTQEFHYGLDMAAPEGSYIRNWWSGKVVEVSDDSNCGTSVVVESGPWEHIYCHMQGYVTTDSRGRSMLDQEGGVQIYEGQMVPAGARIGRVGMTGRTTGPHLHWGLKYSSQWVDPALVLRAMYAQQARAAS
ncbi:M23 family metallopeptidase [Trichothermofontia sp.]